jgi:hypothetical protein
VLRTKRQRILFIAGLVLVLCVLVFVVLFEGRPVTVTADGRRIAIEKVTFGTHHSFTLGKWWVRLLKPIRGKRWAALRGTYETRITNDLPALMVWTRWEGLHRLNARVAVEATLVDETGIESELVLNRWNAFPESLSGGPGPQDGYVAWLFPNFPRQAKKIRLRIYDRDSRHAPTQAVEIAFSNPARTRTPERRGSVLPVVVTTNNAQFSLTSVQPSSNALWRFNFLVRTNGQPDYSWLVGSITASNANGNTLSTRSNLDTRGTTNLSFQLRGALWPEDPAWRFATAFLRTVDFQPSELWTLTNIAIPTRALPFHFTTNFISLGNRPAEFKLESVPRGVPWRPRGIRRNANVYVLIEAPDLHLLLTEAVDDQGRQIPREVDPGAPGMVYAFGLAIPAGARSINLTFALRKPTIVTFDVAASAPRGTSPR